MSAGDGPTLPGGTVTFVFIDIERSTELLQRLGGAYPELLATYRRLTDTAVAGGDGVVFGSEGDGLFIAFPEAGSAVHSAVEAQRAYSTASWPGGVEVKVRMGIHTGTPTLIGDDYTGIDVHRTARIMSAAWGGQVLLSEATHSLISDLGVPCRDLGRFDMKGLTRPERLYQLEHAGLATDFPPVRARRREAELPVLLTSFVGRQDDLAGVIELFDEGARLVTLTGPGGIGKSRLAIAAAARLDPGYAEGVRFVDLSNETDPDRVPTAIAERIGVPPDAGRPALDILVEHLASLDILLVLDGFERVVASAVSIANLLSRCPKLRLLVTSRVGLRIGGERELMVGPLDWGGPDGAPGPGVEAPAVHLFVDRARLARPDLELTRSEMAVIRDLVERLEGSPLAIELAAARARLLPPQAILDRLGGILDLATTSPDLPTRQRSLRATIEWSHSLLSESDQQLFRRLGVFVEGWALDAAEAVAGDAAPDVFLGLENLAAQSMIRVDQGGRMGMGSAMREFALERLLAAGDEEEARLRHAEHFERLVVENEPLLRGPRQRETVAMLSREWRNLRTAAQWALEKGRVDLAGSLYVRTWIVAWQGDNWADSVFYTKELMASADRLDETLRAKALFVAAGTNMEMGESEAAISYARAAVELAMRTGDKDTEAWARLMIAGSAQQINPADVEAKSQITRAVELAESIDDPFVLGYALSFQAAMATMEGDLETGLANHRRVLQIARELENVPMMTQTYAQVAMTHLAAGEPAAAREVLEAAFENLERLRSLEGLAVYLDTVAWLAFAEGDEVRAMTALGAANATRERVGLVRWALIASLLEAAGVAAEAGTPELSEARLAGSAMAPHDAIAYALQSHHELAPAG
jgi:predicted ATPase/class 3 adenylate cyclase